jgi:hypothetical protein
MWIRKLLNTFQFLIGLFRGTIQIERTGELVRVRFRFLFTLFLVLAHSPYADATWSITIADSETGEIAVGISTCLDNIDLLALAPVAVVGKGVGASQSIVDTDGMRRMTIFAGLQSSISPLDILTSLAALVDHEGRQYGIADTQGRTLTFTGSSNFAFANGVTGSSGSLHYAIQGNILTGQPVIDAAEQAVVTTPGDVPEKLMAAMQAARAMGGDGRCSCPGMDPTACGSPPPSFTHSSINGGMVVARIGDIDDTLCDASGCVDGDYFMRLNVAGQMYPEPDAVLQLQTLFDAFRSDLEGRPDAIQSVVTFGPSGMTIVPLDWRRGSVTAVTESLTAEHAPASDGLATIGSVVERPDGTFFVPITTSGTVGIDRFFVTIDDGIRPVVLMPHPTLQYVSIDIKPTSDPNSINPINAGVVPVAILGSDTFHVMDIAAMSLRFGPAGAPPAHDLANPAVFANHVEDLNGDGLADLISHYRTQRTGIDRGDVQACVSGEAVLPFLGCDSVRTRAPHTTHSALSPEGMDRR